MIKISGLLISTIMLIVFISPTIILAETGGQQGSEVIYTNDDEVEIKTTSQGSVDNQQAQPSDSERTKNPVPQVQSEQPKTAEEQLFQDSLSCSITGILSNAIGNLITAAIGGVTSALLNTEVSVQDQTQRAKDTGISINIFGVGIPIMPSWDSIGYCLANQVIAYISDATISWIRGGFEGNPVFVDNPGQFFQQVADFEYESFMDDIAGELLCEPFKINIINNLSNSYNQSPYGQNGSGKCSLYDNNDAGNVDAFLAGEYFDWDVWMDYTQNDANNPIGSELLARNELSRRISARQNSITIDLNWGNGFLPWKDQETGNTITPGHAIQTQLADRLGLDESRLTLADEFDEVVSELVNYLVRTALNETFGAINN